MTNHWTGEDDAVSKSLYWRQAQPPPPDHDLPFQLRKAISQRFWGHDGSLNGEEILITREHVPYFEGLADAGIEGADELVKVIREHGDILLWIDE